MYEMVDWAEYVKVFTDEDFLLKDVLSDWVNIKTTPQTVV